MADPLTPTQARVLEFIAQHIVQKQRPPTRRGIAQHFGWSSDNAAETHIQELARRGHVALDDAARPGKHSNRYVRVLLWPVSVPPLIRIAA